MAIKSVQILDTTLRDGAQAANVSFTIKDKIRISQALDELGVDYIEGGWPGSNPKDEEFFGEIAEVGLAHSKVAAFGSTRKKGVKSKDDSNLSAILKSGAEVAVIFGKSWTLHVHEVLRVSKEENLNIIHDSVSFLKSSGLEVIFDAEHFFQGFFHHKEYALSALKTAEEAHADVIVLCDTNGGTLPNQIFEATKEAVSRIMTKIGVHMHNDIGCGVANTVMGVMAGARHIQGTINGIGERTGNADLTQIIPTLDLKLGLEVLRGHESLKRLGGVSKLVNELAGLPQNPYQPYVGDNAFAHKAGVHVDAILKNTRAYEHVNPELVGNVRAVMISELSGTANLLAYAREVLGIKADKNDKRFKDALAEIKEMERHGYSFDVAPASALLILMRHLGLGRKLVDMEYWKVISESSSSIGVVKANSELRVAEGVGPVHAVESALREALVKDFPSLSSVALTDYRVILPGEVKNTESTVRVTVECSDGSEKWRTTGVSTNVVEASLKALVDGFEYRLQLGQIRHPGRSRT